MLNKALSLSIFLVCAVGASGAFAQTVYFERFLAGSGTVSSISPLGPAESLLDLAGNPPNARAGGVESNGSGLIFYTDRSADQILAVDVSRNIYPILLPFSGLKNPQSISLDARGNFLYVADFDNRRIVRVNLSMPLPTNSVQIVVDASAGVTDLVADLKYNPVDGYLYWTNDGAFHRAAIAGQRMPVQSGETMITKNSIEVRYFDFDLARAQTVYFSSGSGGFQGIYSARVPAVGDTPNLNEVSILSTAATPDITTTGIAVDKNGPYFCYTAVNTPSPVLRCGDRTTTPISSFTDLLSSQFTLPPNFLVIDSPSSVVSPSTTLPAPVLQLNMAIPNPEVLILLRQFDSAVLRAAGRGATRIAALRGSASKITFRYLVDINKSKDASGKNVSMAKRDVRRKYTDRNLVTARNLRSNSTYEVSYSIEISRKMPGEPPKVVSRTKLSPVSSFIIPQN